MASVFAKTADDLFTTYRARIRIRGKIMGGTPRDPKLIEGWLRAKAGVDSDEETRQAVLRTLGEIGAEVPAEASYDELVKATEKVGAERYTQGFKRDETGIYIEARIVKAALRESTNILWAKDAEVFKGKNPTGKGAKAFVVERLFIDPDKLYLCRPGPDGSLLPLRDADGVHLQIGHVSTPRGPKATLSYHEYAENAEFDVLLSVMRDFMGEKHWGQLFSHAEQNGLGAVRSQSYGRFETVAFERMDRSDPAVARVLHEHGSLVYSTGDGYAGADPAAALLAAR
jgi:hypothetical protein